MFYEVKIEKNGLRNFIICKQRLKLKRRIKYLKNNFNDKKLDNSLSRAKSKIFEYLTNNNFVYFVTLTFNDNYDRFNLSSLRSKFSQIIRDMRKSGFTDLIYLIVPEKHKNGAFHFHGFLGSGFSKDLYINDNGFYSLSHFDKLGFNSVSKIDNYEACAKYITKYINKDLLSIDKNNYLYFHSQKLNTNIHYCSFITYGLLPLKFDYENNYVSKVTLNYYNFVTFIDFMKSNNKIIM